MLLIQILSNCSIKVLIDIKKLPNLLRQECSSVMNSLTLSSSLLSLFEYPVIEVTYIVTKINTPLVVMECLWLCGYEIIYWRNTYA